MGCCCNKYCGCGRGQRKETAVGLWSSMCLARSGQWLCSGLVYHSSSALFVCMIIVLGIFDPNSGKFVVSHDVMCSTPLLQNAGLPS